MPHSEGCLVVIVVVVWLLVYLKSNSGTGTRSVGDEHHLCVFLVHTDSGPVPSNIHSLAQGGVGGSEAP